MWLVVQFSYTSIEAQKDSKKLVQRNKGATPISLIDKNPARDRGYRERPQVLQQTAHAARLWVTKIADLEIKQKSQPDSKESL